MTVGLLFLLAIGVMLVAVVWLLLGERALVGGR